MFYTIYKITNNLNGKIYIGKHQTSDINDDYMGSGKILLQAIKKYGLENFKKEILYIFSNELEMNQKERELVTEEFCKSTSTYNLNPGGKGGFGYLNSTGKNHKHKNRKGSLENLQLGREKARHLRENDPEFKTRVSKSISESKKKYFQDNPANFKGKTHSKEVKEKLGFLSKGRKIKKKPEHLEKEKQTRFEKNNGKFFSEETIEKIRQKAFERQERKRSLRAEG
mgnify:FL=1